MSTHNICLCGEIRKIYIWALILSGVMIIIMLNKFDALPTSNSLTANPIAWFRYLIQIHILNDKWCQSRSVGF